MLSEPRIYRYSTMRLVLLIILLLALGIVPFFILSGANFQYALAMFGFIGLLILLSIFMMTRSTTVTNDEISTRGLLGEASLKWNEVDSAFGNGNKIKLRNRDGDVTVSPAPHLPGYPEVIEIIGAKRPDLFSPADYPSMSRSWFEILFFLVVGAGLLGAGVYLYFASEETMMKTLFLGGVVLGLFVFTFMSVLSIKFDGSQLTIRYLLNKIVLNQQDVRSINLGVMQTRTGKSYSILITTQNRVIRFSGVGPSVPVTYLVLKNWHQGAAS